MDAQAVRKCYDELIYKCDAIRYVLNSDEKNYSSSVPLFRKLCLHELTYNCKDDQQVYLHAPRLREKKGQREGIRKSDRWRCHEVCGGTVNFLALETALNRQSEGEKSSNLKRRRSKRARSVQERGVHGPFQEGGVLREGVAPLARVLLPGGLEAAQGDPHRMGPSYPQYICPPASYTGCPKSYIGPPKS